MVRSALILAALLAASPAVGEPRREITIPRVAYGDLDLKSEAGAQMLLRRLAAAANALCTYTPSPVFPRAAAQAWRCRNEAIAAAVARVNAPRLRLGYAEFLAANPAAIP